VAQLKSRPTKATKHAPTISATPADVARPERSRTVSADDSSLLINAVLKRPFPPVSLPKKEYMERAAQIWEELGLPKIEKKHPWYGYSLGQWDEELEEEADLALKGEHYQTGKKLAQNKVKMSSKKSHMVSSAK